MQPATFQLTDFESKFSGNVIEICPVGALTSAKYRFRARPWDLETKPGICTVTPCGTNIWFDYRASKFVRINGRTNEAVNEEWTADRCKFGHDFYNHPNRISAPNKRSGDQFIRTTWSDLNKTIANLLQDSGQSTALLTSQRVSNEGLFTAKALFDLINSPFVDSRSKGDDLTESERAENKFGGTKAVPIADLENQTGILIFGTSLADEQPMSFLRVRKGWFQNGTKVVVAHSAPTDADSFAHVVLRYKPGTQDHAAAAIAAALGAAPSVDFSASCAKAGLAESDVKEAASVLKGESVTTLTTHSLTVSPQGIAAYHILAGSAASQSQGFNYLGLDCNSSGAKLLGLVPPTNAHNTKAILEKCASGEIKTLVLLDFDPLDDFPYRDIAEKALEKVENLILITAIPGSTAAYATHILPMALPAEQDGTYTSCEGRIQRMNQIIPAPGETKAPWRIFTELALRIKPGTPAFNPAEIMDRMAQTNPAFAETTYDKLPATGTIIKQAVKPFDSQNFNGGFPKLS
jgi:NADH-quinone oxidoreductase subunit G